MKAKVLVVDDEPETRRVVRRVLQEAGHEIIEADDGAAVPDLMLRERPTLVVMDIHMPRVDGILALSEIHDIDPTVAVVMLTGDSDIRRIRTALERGATEYLMKPFDIDALRVSIASSLEKRARRQAESARRMRGQGL